MNDIKTVTKKKDENNKLKTPLDDSALMLDVRKLKYMLQQFQINTNAFGHTKNPAIDINYIYYH